MKKSHVLAVIFLVIPLSSCAQNYLPLAKGNKWSFGMGYHSFVDEIVQDDFSFNGKKYFMRLRKIKYAENDTLKIDTTYLRVTTDGSIRYLDRKLKKEINWIPNKPTIGQSWTSADNEWKFTIVETSASLQAMKKTYNNCIVIKEEQIEKRESGTAPVYIHYYSKDIGYAGMKVREGLAVWLLDYNLK